MIDRFETEKRKRVEAARRLLAEAGRSRDIQAFAEALYAQGAGEDIAACPPETLAVLAARACDFVAEWRGEAPALRLFDLSGERAGERPATVIEILNTDRPFIVDSVLSELRASGLSPRLVLHPILDIQRGADGRLDVSLAGRGTRGAGLRASYVHVHVPPVPSAAREGLQERLMSLLEEIRVVTDDWGAMRARVRQAIEAWRANPPLLPGDSVAEAIAFLDWLVEDNFTFLGLREYDYGGVAGAALAEPQGEGLGILRDPNVKVLRRGGQLVTMTPEIREFLLAPEPLIVTKANVVSRVHRRDYMDFVAAKIFGPDSRVRGELRIVGLFTSEAYVRSVLTIPFIRRKAERIIARAGFDPSSHSGKALLNILENHPRTELFQADESVLYDAAIAILQLNERPRVRVLARRDRFDRFVSVLVFVPRDRYSSELRERIGEALAQAYDARVSAFVPSFPDGPLTRVHFILGRNPGEGPDPSQGEVEARVRALVRTFEDDLADAVAAAFPPADAERILATYRHAFGREYRAAYTALDAVADIEVAESLAGATAIAARFFRHAGAPADRVALRLHHLDTPIPLSQRVPLLENLGFRVINERTYQVRPSDGPLVYLHDMTLVPKSGEAPDVEEAAERLRAAVLSVWEGRAENDGFNALVLVARLDWREAALLRSIGRYLRQTQLPYSIDYLWDALSRHPNIAGLLVRRFSARFAPDLGDREAAEARADAELDAALDAVKSLDDDTMLRAFRQVIQAAQRTDFYTRDAADRPPLAITLKLKPDNLPFVPAPRPFREIFTHSPQVEGVHMRFGPVARGGLRWSDRPQDYRVEVLGLVKAQQVKNAVIVPVGAKGGFVPKAPPAGTPREATFEAGRQAYIAFVDRLLSVTDNLEGDRVVPPARVVRHDPDDPYLVVAADKGTATFSDTANSISLSHDFWLGDAFASGGSAGYDHKVMGITARGAWEAVKRHFREMDVDIQVQPFSVAGVGDMSGDVFGNGMLLSPAIRLVAAFDHRDIFLDPDPDPARALAERRRLFDLPRSSWQDYDRSVLSEGGGIFSRRDKQVPLSPQIQALLGLDQPSARPNEVIRAILRANVDLLWFGGIGTYVRAPSESDLEVGDKANDAVRITADELQAKVIGEGANLAMTQAARIAYNLRGGRSNSDAIDNSGGVNSSDVEVNIKVALSPAVRAGRLPIEARNDLLRAMTDEVAELVLRNNYQQTLAISLESARGLDNLANQGRLMTDLEGRGLLDRRIENLPDDAMLAERLAAKLPLTRAEIGVLLAYAKITLFDDLVGSGVPDDPYLARELFRYFPEKMREPFAADIEAHRLRREIIATQLSNSLINRGGPTLMVRMRDRAAASAADVVRAYAAVRDSLDLQDLHARIDTLDNEIPGQLQLDLYLLVQDVLNDRLVWFLRNVDLTGGIAAVVAHYSRNLGTLAATLPTLLPPFVADAVAARRARLAEARVPEDLADRLAMLPALAEAADVVRISDETGRSLEDAARAYYAVMARFHLGRIQALAQAVETADYYESLAVEKARDTLQAAHVGLAEGVLHSSDGAPDLSRWEAACGRKVNDTMRQVEAILLDGRATAAKATVAAGLLAELAAQRAPAARASAA